ncbi:MAG TPA: TIGR02453 family protein [Candidatus Dormibacteraeota bacterium]|jgi:uncharacterized protein (TIGR02453 family)|nr:TIGR02453 family protein [Candidatus Dormibacteraeota bacterium]
MAGEAHFTPALFAFLRDLKAHNDRDWFLASKKRYETDVKEPALRFIADVAPGLRQVNPNIVAEPRSLFRINRDVRFSADKSPYKTNVGMGFGFRRSDAGPAPGYYLHIEPGETFAGGGIHMPDNPTLTRVRDAIVADPAGWKRIVGDPTFAPMAVHLGESLKRAPQGYAPDHELVADLKRKSYTWHVKFTEAEVCGADFMARYLDACRTAAPYTGFLARAVGAPW